MAPDDEATADEIERIATEIAQAVGHTTNDPVLASWVLMRLAAEYAAPTTTAAEFVRDARAALRETKDGASVLPPPDLAPKSLPRLSAQEIALHLHAFSHNTFQPKAWA